MQTLFNIHLSGLLMKPSNVWVWLLFTSNLIWSQSFYFGADLSYVNEMEDCGVIYYENQGVKDPYLIFAQYGCNLVRLRLWHTPQWYDQLNQGIRYSDLADVKKSILRCKEQEMPVLLNFHLSDNWADPGKQLIPAAWLDVVDHLPVLQDSLYQYIYRTLEDLAQNDLLPAMVQIGNETNKGILLSPEDNAQWTLDWNRNAALFNTAIHAVRDIEQNFQASIDIMLHVAGPEDTEWLIEAFINNGVTDFDVIGVSYYWAWHQPTTISETGDLIRRLRKNYNDKAILIAETAYIWTDSSNDQANNIINETHPDFYPPSPQAQKAWMTSLTQEVLDAGGQGVIYWEPAWVSSSCFTQWGQGSHQEHATFFDFNNQLIIPGGIEWMNHTYETTTLTTSQTSKDSYPTIQLNHSSLIISQEQPLRWSYTIVDSTGRKCVEGIFQEISTSLNVSRLSNGTFFITFESQDQQDRVTRSFIK